MSCYGFSFFKGAKIIKELIDLAVQKNVKIHLPVDFVIADQIKESADTSVVDAKLGIPSDKMVNNTVC